MQEDSRFRRDMAQWTDMAEKCKSSARAQGGGDIDHEKGFDATSQMNPSSRSQEPKRQSHSHFDDFDMGIFSDLERLEEAELAAAELEAANRIKAQEKELQEKEKNGKKHTTPDKGGWKRGFLSSPTSSNPTKSTISRSSDATQKKASATGNISKQSRFGLQDPIEKTTSISGISGGKEESVVSSVTNLQSSASTLPKRPVAFTGSVMERFP